MPRCTRCWLLTICLVVGLAFSVSVEPVVVEHMMPAYQGAIIEASEKIMELFHSEQDDVRVEITKVAGGLNEYLEHLTVRVAAGESPDVIRMPARLGDVIGLDLVLPLNKYIERDGLACRMIPPAMELSKWRGQVVNIPTSYTAFTTYYNVEMFNEAGIADPNQLAASGDWDWETWIDVAKRVTKDTNNDGALETAGISSTPSPNKMPRGSIFFNMAGGYYFDRYVDPTESKMTSEPVMTALTFINSLVNEHNVWGWPHKAFRFRDGVSAMAPDGAWEIGFIRDAEAEFDWDVAPLPAGPAGSDPVIHTTGFQISKTAPHPDAAWKWLRFLGSDPRAAEIFMIASGEPPACADVAPEYARAIQIEGTPGHSQVLVDELLRAKGVPIIPVVPRYTEFNAAYQREVTAMLDQKQGVTETAEKIHAAFSQLLSEIAEK